MGIVTERECRQTAAESAAAMAFQSYWEAQMRPRF